MSAAATPVPRPVRFDRRWRRITGAHWLAGTDEVGRGCLAGPVVVAAVALPADVWVEGVADSKTLSASRREAIFTALLRSPARWAAVAVPAREIDARNVLAASLHGMERAVERWQARHHCRVDHVLVDGHLIPEGLRGRATAVVKGDSRSHCIAAASIVAKVVRDRLMRSWARHHPEYGFERHVGYPTPEHLGALARYGVCRLHRRSFAPVARIVSEQHLDLREEAGDAEA